MGTKRNEDLWKKYCEYFERDFASQLEQNENDLQEFMKKWSQTKTAKRICARGCSDIEDVPITTYDDYEILHQFGDSIEDLLVKNPKPKGELWWDYYKRIEEPPKKLLDGWLPDKYEACGKTTGTTGKSKWFAYGQEFMQNLGKEVVSTVVLTAAKEWGNTEINRGDVVLNMGAPVPYIGGYSARTYEKEFECFPPIEVTDEMTDMRKKLNLILNGLKRGQKLDVAAALASTFHLFATSLIEPEKLYWDYYKSMDLGIKKLILYFMYLKAKWTKRHIERACEILPVKGLGTSGLDTKLYAEYLKEQFGFHPLNVYGSTEFGVSMVGMPDRRMDLMPTLRVAYFEFLDEEGELKRIDELKRDHVYELVGTCFGTMLCRYAIEDLFKVVDFRDDGTPVFDFYGRKTSLISIRDYFRIGEALAFQVLHDAGLRNSERWAVTKYVEPEEHLCFLMERDWNYDEIEASKRIYRALLNSSEDFRSYTKAFCIKKPTDIIKVTYLKRGSFMRYSMKKVKKGVPIGQYKSPKILLPSRKEDIDLLCD